MDPQQVMGALLQVHQDIQDDLGESDTSISPDSTPLTDFGGFDSLLVPSSLRLVAQSIGWSPPAGTRFPNLYVSPDGTAKLTIGQIADRFCETFGKARVA